MTYERWDNREVEWAEHPGSTRERLKAEERSDIEDKNQLIGFELPIHSMKLRWVQKASLNISRLRSQSPWQKTFGCLVSLSYFKKRKQWRVWDSLNWNSHTKCLIWDIFSFVYNVKTDENMGAERKKNKKTKKNQKKTSHANSTSRSSK